MERDAIERIRTATFPVARKGYDKREVHRFLDELAAWLETGGSDEARSELVRDELLRVGEQTAIILTDAHDTAEAMREDADRQIRQQLTDANLTSESVRSEADEYAEHARQEADAYSRRTRVDADEERSEADGYAERIRAEAEEQVARLRSDGEALIAEARQKAERIATGVIEQAKQRRGELEQAISGLEDRRGKIVAELRRLASEAGGTGATPAGGETEGDAPGARAADESSADGPVGEAEETGEETTRAIPVRQGADARG